MLNVTADASEGFMVKQISLHPLSLSPYLSIYPSSLCSRRGPYASPPSPLSPASRILVLYVEEPQKGDAFPLFCLAYPTKFPSP